MSDEVKSEFARKFYDAKVEKEITYRDIKAATGLSIGYLCDIAQDRRPAPEMAIVRRIEEVLGIADRSLQIAAVNSRKPTEAELIAEIERLKIDNAVSIKSDNSKVNLNALAEVERLKNEIARRDEVLSQIKTAGFADGSFIAHDENLGFKIHRRYANGFDCNSEGELIYYPSLFEVVSEPSLGSQIDSD